VPGVDLAAPVIKIDTYNVVAAGTNTEATVYGVSWRQAGLFGLKVAKGRYLDAFDENHNAQVCVIGQTVRRDLDRGFTLDDTSPVSDLTHQSVKLRATNRENMAQALHLRRREVVCTTRERWRRHPHYRHQPHL